MRCMKYFLPSCNQISFCLANYNQISSSHVLTYSFYYSPKTPTLCLLRDGYQPNHLDGYETIYNLKIQARTRGFKNYNSLSCPFHLVST